ncbi:MAG: GerMN domain-containing protein, partial [Actinomycetota bacterium]
HLSRDDVQLQPVGSLPEALLFALLQQDPTATSTAIPVGTRLNDLAVANTVATVDLSGDFEQAAPPRSQALRIAQVVYTLTDETTGITGVRFEIDGVPQEAIGGVTLSRIPRPVTRTDYQQFAPSAAREQPEG